MDADRLFLLKPGFLSNDSGPLFCPASMVIEGLLSVYPALRDSLDVCYVDFERPRWPLLRTLGEENQACPVLIVANPKAITSAHLCRTIANDLTTLTEPLDICDYLADAHRVVRPHRP